MKRKIANAITIFAFIVAGASIMALGSENITIPLCGLAVSFSWIYMTILLSKVDVSVDPELQQIHRRIIERGEENKKGSEGDSDTNETA